MTNIVDYNHYLVFSSILIFCSGLFNVLYNPCGFHLFWGYIFMYIGIFSTLRWGFPNNKFLQTKDRITVRVVFCYLFYWMLTYDFFDETEKWFLSGIGVSIFFYYALSRFKWKKCIFHLIMHMYVIFGVLCLNVLIKN